jgi:hypothetical protein
MMPILFKALAGLSLALLTSTAWGGDDAKDWSKPVNGLRARLSVLPPKEKDTPFCRVFLELENTSDVAGQKKIRFSPEKLSLKVTDKEGKELLRPASGAYDGISPLWEPIALPYAGSIKFQVSFPGLGYHPETDKVIVDVGAEQAWVIPQDGTAYSLAGSFSIERQQSDHPSMDWSGTLELPMVEIPSATSLAPKTGPLKQEMVGALFERIERREKIEFDLLCKALIGPQTTLRAEAATLLGESGDKRAIPFLIDALADESTHVGAKYVDPGDATTRHRANKALKNLTGQDFGFVWSDPKEKRRTAIDKWIE